MGTGLILVLYFFSLLLPLVGIIIGLIWGFSEDPQKRGVGRMCILLGIFSIFLSFLCYWFWLSTWWVWY